MNRRHFLHGLAGAGLLAATGAFGDASSLVFPDNWLATWRKHVLEGARDRYCDSAMGEDTAWLISPFLTAFYYGWLATRDRQWIEVFVDWTDSWIKRAVKEPDGFLGWPKMGGLSTQVDHLDALCTDSLLGDADALSPVALMSRELLNNAKLRGEYGPKAEAYIKLSERTFEKWEQRGAWRETKPGQGIWIALACGMDPATGQWTDSYKNRNEPSMGLSFPDNKANATACWHLAMYDATRKPVYRDRAEKWFRLMKSRMTRRDNGRYFVWNYWEPAGSWDKRPNGETKHWVGVHPNGGYYIIDVEAVVAAYEHQLVFTKEDIDRLVATNRDFMWNHKINGAKFQRIDGGPPDDRWKNTPGVLWAALCPYDKTLTEIFLANNDPGSWGGIAGTPRFLVRQNAAKNADANK